METSDRKPIVMVVDDQPKNLEVIGNILSERYDIIAVNSGAKALKCLEMERPDLLLLEVMMPEMSGFQFCLELKAKPEYQDIPVIFLTALAEDDDVLRGFQAGGVDYITKPFKPLELLARVGAHVGTHMAKTRVVEVLAEKASMLHLLTHDLKNPIAGVDSLLEHLTPLPKDAEELISMIKTGVRQALAIIDHVSSLLALETGKINLKLETVNLRACLSEAEMMLRGKFLAKRVILVTDCPDGAWVIAETVSLVNSVLGNLLTNALKFSFPGSVVAVKVEVGEKEAILLITDNGIGIPREILATLFSMSKPTNRIGTEGERGTGFGMPLVKKHVEAYGGEIEVSSQDITSSPADHGTVVRITLPSALPQR